MKKTSKKDITIMAVGVILLLILIGLVRFIPIPDKYSGWKTYENSEMGFSIMYPPDFNVKDIDRVGRSGINISSPDKEIVLEIDSLEKYIEFQDFVQTERGILVSSSTQSSFSIDNIQGVKLSATNKDGTGIIILAEKEQLYYRIVAIIKSEGRNTYLPIFDQMISSFKFTNSQ